MTSEKQPEKVVAIKVSDRLTLGYLDFPYNDRNKVAKSFEAMVVRINCSSDGSGSVTTNSVSRIAFLAERFVSRDGVEMAEVSTHPELLAYLPSELGRHQFIYILEVNGTKIEG